VSAASTSRPGGRSPLRSLRTYLRALASLVISAITVWLCAAVLPGLRVLDLEQSFVAAALVALFNALIWPTLVRLALPITVITIGIAGLVLNGLLVWLAFDLVEGVGIADLPTAILVALILTMSNTVVTGLLGIDDDDFYYRNVIRRAARRQVDTTLDESIPGILFLEIDGLSDPVLRRAIRDGNVPTLARWIREGSHRLEGWECDWSSQTSASQAGLLHGSNHDIPAFRWFEKERGAFVVSNHPAGAAEIERRVSDGRGLLAFGGASRGNLLTGDAPHTSFTIAGLRARPTRGGDYYAYFANPYTVLRTFLLSLLDIGRELLASAQQKRRDVQPRVKRGFRYALLRAVTVVILRDIAVQTIIADAYAGRPVLYATFVGYDEVAHHSGIERHDALDVLRGIDRAFDRIAHAAETADRPYHVVVLSDHGQSQGATFLQRHGHSLEQVVHDACGLPAIASPYTADEAWGSLNATASELLVDRGRLTRAATRAREEGDALVFGPDYDAAAEPSAFDEAEVKVLASGSLGLVFIGNEPGRLTREEIDARHPRLLSRLVEHPGVGFVLVRSAEHGPLAIGRDGVHRLADGVVEGEDPLRVYGPNAARHVLRSDGFPHVADIMVNGSYDPMTGEITAFEELVGSHGGLGGEQMHPFVLFPRSFAWTDEPVVSAEHMHRIMVGWLEDLGHRRGAPGGDA
jgi:uncharacterized membrane protein YvlD (DUF360 family)